MTSGLTIAIVPVKALVEAKSRLAPALSTAGRQRLVLAMLDDVLATLRASPGIARTLVVTPDSAILGHVAGSGAEVLLETEPADLNGAVRLGLRHVEAARAARALVLPADVPLVTSAEVERVLACDAPVVIVPSRDGEGTNALLLPPACALAPSFGSDSCRRHVRLAEAAGLRAHLLALDGLGRDIDHPADLASLVRLDRYAWLRDAIARPLV